MAKKFGLLLLGGAALLVGCGLAAPSLPSSQPVNLPLSVKATYAEKAIAGVSMLASQGLVQTTPAQPGPLLRHHPDVNAGPTLVTEETMIAQFTEYITLMDSLLSEEGNPFQFVELPSDRPEYTYHLSVTITDLAGNVMSYHMYFNVKDEVITDPTSSEMSSEISSEVTTSEIVSEDPSSEIVSEDPSSMSMDPSSPLNRRGDDHEDEEDEEEDEDEVDREEHEQYNDEVLRDRSDENSYREHHERDFEDEGVLLEGVVIFDGVEYRLLGIQETEEDEIESKFFISLDENNWIKIKREVEEDEQKYDLSMRKDGVFSKFTFKIETEDDGEIQIKLKTLINGQLISYSFKKDIEDGVEIIKIRIVENNQILHVKAIPTVDDNGDTIYQFYVLESGRGYEGRPHDDHDRGGFRP